MAAIAIPQYQNYVARAQVSEAFSLASGAKTAVAEYFMLNGTFPADNGTAGLSEATDISGNYVESVTVAGGTITALFSDTEAHSKLQGKSMVLTAVVRTSKLIFPQVVMLQVPRVEAVRLVGMQMGTQTQGVTGRSGRCWATTTRMPVRPSAPWQNAWDRERRSSWLGLSAPCNGRRICHEYYWNAPKNTVLVGCWE